MLCYREWSLCVGAYESARGHSAVRVRSLRSDVRAARQLAEAHGRSHRRTPAPVPQVFALVLRHLGDAASRRRHTREGRALRLRQVRPPLPASVVGAVAPHAARQHQAVQLRHVWTIVRAPLRLAETPPHSPARRRQSRWRQAGSGTEAWGIHRLPHRVAVGAILPASQHWTKFWRLLFDQKILNTIYWWERGDSTSRQWTCNQKLWVQLLWATFSHPCAHYQAV